MAFKIRNLSVLNYANGFTLWHYRAELDDLAVVKADGYFNDAQDMLQFGDVLLINASNSTGFLTVVVPFNDDDVRTSSLAM